MLAERLGIDRTTMSEETHALVLAHGEYQVDQAERRMFGRLGLAHGSRFAECLARVAPVPRRL